MVITVVSTIGVGKTKLSAFDNALSEAGVNNYNLIVLSSVIPMHASVVKRTKMSKRVGAIGDRLYVVKADMRSSKQGKVIASALGWYSFESGGGIFVEHEASGSSKSAVKKRISGMIEQSIRDLCSFRNIPFQMEKMCMSTSISKVTTAPTCVLTIAVYKAEPW